MRRASQPRATQGGDAAPHSFPAIASQAWRVGGPSSLVVARSHRVLYTPVYVKRMLSTALFLGSLDASAVSRSALGVPFALDHSSMYAGHDSRVQKEGGCRRVDQRLLLLAPGKADSADIACMRCVIIVEELLVAEEGRRQACSAPIRIYTARLARAIDMPRDQGRCPIVDHLLFARLVSSAAMSSGRLMILSAAFPTQVPVQVSP